MDPTDAPNALDLAAIGERVKSMISECRLDGTEFASSVGVPYSTMRSYLSGNRAPSAEFLSGVFRVHGFMPSWLLTGDEPRRLADVSASQNIGNDFISIPLLPIQVSAGNGAVNEPHVEYNVNGLCFSRTWLASRRLNPQSLKVVEVRGSSMDGVLSHGDLVLIDLADTRPRSGFVYVLRQADELLVKYCQLLPGGVLRVSSANPQYASYDVVLDETSDVQIVGRVVASMHEW